MIKEFLNQIFFIFIKLQLGPCEWLWFPIVLLCLPDCQWYQNAKYGHISKKEN